MLVNNEATREILIHFKPMFSFYTPWKQKNLWFSEETSGFPMISEETIGLKRSNSLV